MYEHHRHHQDDIADIAVDYTGTVARSTFPILRLITRRRVHNVWRTTLAYRERSLEKYE